MSINGLQTPFDRLSILKTPMNWRGLWVNDSNYLLNDVVISPDNSGAYILTGVVALVSTTDPINDPNWTEVSATSVGINSITGGNGIIINSLIPNTPEIINDGVLTVAQGVNISVDNTDPHNPVVSSTAVGNLVPSTGISIDNTDPVNPVISNSGVTSLIGGTGVGVSSATGDITIQNNGVRTLSVGAGLTVNSPTGDVLLTNTGVASVKPGQGIEIIGPTSSPQINNVGVLSIAPADGTITVGGTIQDVTLSATVSRISYLYLSGSFAGGGFNVPPNGTGTLTYTQPAAPNLVTTLMLNGDTDNPNSIFIFDMTSVALYFSDTTSVLNSSFTVSFVDSVTVGGPYVYTAIVPNGGVLIPSAVTGIDFPLAFNIGSCYFNIAGARATGMRVITAVQITNLTSSTMKILGSNSVLAQYFPVGLE
jgi:hypothetical protein